jgi:histidinol-phosphate phosphatase family protein
MSCASRAAVFLDRDGTIIADAGYISDPEDVVLLDGVCEGLQELRQAGYALVIVSNQSGVARQLITPRELCAVHERVLAELVSRGVGIDGAYYCPHCPDDSCDCRKPLPGLLLRAAADLEIDLRRSFCVGDSRRDVEAGRSAGCTTILLGADDAGASEAGVADAVLGDWRSVSKFIIGEGRRDG